LEVEKRGAWPMIYQLSRRNGVEGRIDSTTVSMIALDYNGYCDRFSLADVTTDKFEIYRVWVGSFQHCQAPKDGICPSGRYMVPPFR
jgi:hypothetical protein